MWRYLLLFSMSNQDWSRSLSTFLQKKIRWQLNRSIKQLLHIKLLLLLADKKTVTNNRSWWPEAPERHHDCYWYKASVGGPSFSISSSSLSYSYSSSSSFASSSFSTGQPQLSVLDVPTCPWLANKDTFVFWRPSSGGFSTTLHNFLAGSPLGAALNTISSVGTGYTTDTISSVAFICYKLHHQLVSSASTISTTWSWWANGASASSTCPIARGTITFPSSQRRLMMGLEWWTNVPSMVKLILWRLAGTQSPLRVEVSRISLV